MKVYLPVALGTKIECDCDDEQCWAGIEVLPNSLSFYRDISDVGYYEQDGIHVDLPEGYELCKTVDVEVPEGFDMLAGSYVLLLEEVKGLKRVLADSYGANGLVNNKLTEAEREIERISHLNAGHVRELVALRSKVGKMQNILDSYGKELEL